MLAPVLQCGQHLRQGSCLIASTAASKSCEPAAAQSHASTSGRCKFVDGVMAKTCF